MARTLPRSLRLAVPLTAVLLGACVTADGPIGFAPADPAQDAGRWSEPAQLVSLERDEEPEGLVAAPELVFVRVGDELSLHLTLTDPSVARIEAAELPEAAWLEEDDEGASVRWKPEYPDIGEHNLVFLIVDADEPQLVLAQTSVIVGVLPGYGLIEYGF
jgi:hypothetical protein